MLKLTAAAMLIFLTAMPRTGWSQVLTGSDIELIDVSPAISFEDSNDSFAGRNFVLRGDQNEFSVWDDRNNLFIFRVSAANDGVALGSNATAGGSRSIAMGVSASAAGLFGTALGYFASAESAEGVALGGLATAEGEGSIALGYKANADASSGIAVGDTATAQQALAVAVGFSASAQGEGSIAMGNQASATGLSSVALGDEAAAETSFASALGVFATSTGLGSSALGYATTATSTFSTAVGHAANASGDRSTALGTTSSAEGNGSLALGRSAAATGDFSTALGFLAYAPNPNTVVLGQIRDENASLNNANVAIGTTLPLAPLHIFRADSTQELLFLESNQAETNQDRPMMRLINNGGIRFQFENDVLGSQWRFQAATGGQDNFEVTRVGSGQIEFRVDAAGNATLAGMLFENSDRNAKTKIERINPDEVLARLTELPISEWEYKDTPGQRHLGPMAQDFREAFGLGANDTSLATIDTSGVALASIQALSQKLEAVNQRNMSLGEENRQLRAELQDLKHLMTGFLAGQSAATAQQ